MTSNRNFYAGALLIAALSGGATWFVASPHRLAWLFGVVTTALVLVITVGLDALVTHGKPPAPPPTPAPAAQPAVPSQLWSRAQHAGTEVQLPEAKDLLTVLNNQLLTIIDAGRAPGDRQELIEDLRKGMESATILLERAKEPRLDQEWLAEELQRMCDNLTRDQENARGALNS
jgi:hypothetical protein